MEGTIGEIRAFGGSFAPAYWMLCQGQQLSINDFQTLYAIVGTNYGGDGISSFNLPNIASRIVIGTGPVQGGTNYALGQLLGEEGHTLLSSEMPMHNHTIQPAFNSTPASASFSLNAINSNGPLDTPENNYLAIESGMSASIYGNPSPSTSLVPLIPTAAKVTSLTPPLANITVSAAGGSQPHSNIQPVTALNYIICVEGIFPSRS